MLLDEILVEIGEFGPYQIVLYCLLGLVGLPTAWQNMAITFYAGAMDHWCQVPQLQNFSHDQQKFIAIPEEGEGYSKCAMYDLPYSNYSEQDLLGWNRSIMIPEGTPTLECYYGWVYDQSVFTSSLVSQFDLVCDQAGRVSLIQTIYMLGFMSGCIGFGQVSDSIGRHKTLMIALVMEVGIATAATFVPYYAAYITMRFFVGVAAAGAFTTIFVMCMEMIGPKYRMATGIFVQGWFALGFMTIPGFSYAIRDHYKLQLVCSLSPIALWSLFFLADESPRWLATEGHDERATKILAKIARVNGTKLPVKLNLEDNRRHVSEKVEGDDHSPNFLDLFRTPGLRRVTCNMWFIWFVTSMVYYGLSLGVDMLPGSIFLNSFLTGVIELPAYVFTIIALQKFGRKLTTSVTLLAGGLCCLLCMAFIEREDLKIGATVFLLIGKFFTSATFAIVYVYAAELFPTVIRQVGVGSSSMCARVGGLIQPQVQRLETFWTPATFLVYGALSVTPGVLSLLLPETLGKRLPETIEEGEAFALTAKLSCRLPQEHESCDKKFSRDALVESGDSVSSSSSLPHKEPMTNLNQESETKDPDNSLINDGQTVNSIYL